MLLDVRQECLSYKGFSEAELEDLIGTQCIPVIAARCDRSRAMLEETSTFLGEEQRALQNIVERFGAFVCRCARISEQHNSECLELADNVQASLGLLRGEVDESDADREILFQNCLRPQKAALDTAAADAMECLHAIEDGYRTGYQCMVSLVTAHPQHVQHLHDKYHVQLCDAFHLRPNCQLPDTGSGQRDQAATFVNEEKVEEDPTSGSTNGSERQLTECVKVVPDHGCIEAGTHRWVRDRDLYEVLMDGTQHGESDPGLQQGDNGDATGTLPGSNQEKARNEHALHSCLLPRIYFALKVLSFTCVAELSLIFCSFTL
jgi:hypothetical protein